LETLNLFLIFFFFKEIFKNKDLLKNFNNNIIIALIIFNFIILISSISSDSVYSIKYPLTFFRYIIFSFSLYLIIYLYPELINKIIYVFVIILIFLFLGTLYEISFKNYCGYYNHGGAFIVEGELCLKLKDYLIGSLSMYRMSSFFW
jgi:hypothetical protein